MTILIFFGDSPMVIHFGIDFTKIHASRGQVMASAVMASAQVLLKTRWDNNAQTHTTDKNTLPRNGSHTSKSEAN